MFKSILPIAVLLLGACSALPTTGPSVSNVANYEGAHFTPVDSATARSMRQTFLTAEADKREADLAFLVKPAAALDYTLMAGDKITVSLTSWSTQINPATGNNSVTMDWPITIAANGDASLPYIKQPLHLAGLSIPAAQSHIASLYANRRIFLAPTVQVTLADDATHGVLVTGTVGEPKTIPWVAGGLNLATALTKVMGNAQILGLQQNSLNGGTSATSVTIIRAGSPKITLPVDVALEHDIPMMQGDKVIVSHKPAVQVTVMGGGISNGLFDFSQHPSLAQAIAQAKGLNPQTANAKSVYVFRNGDEPKLYSFAFQTTDAQFAAQQFPLMDGDIVYVAEAAFVPFQTVMSALWPVAALGSVVR